MATQVSFVEVFSHDGSLWFRFDNGDAFNVKSLNDGVMVINPLCGCTIHSFVKNVTGCFKEGSNFNGLKAIEFDFNGAYISVTAKNADANKIVKFWNEKMEENHLKRVNERMEYMKTLEYRTKRAKALKIATRRQNVEKVVLRVDETTELEFKGTDEKNKWEQFVEVNSKDDYGNSAVIYARRWAKYMQYLMKKHKKSVSQIAENASHMSDIHGITALMHGCAVGVLSEVWKYGEELREWYNKKCAYAGNYVVNPAVLTISTN